MKNKSYLLNILTFIIPVIIISIIFAIQGIVPFGNYTIFTSDSLSQYAMFHSELADKLHSGDNLLYSFRNGMGTDFLIQGSYYFTSPFNILLLFVSSEYIATYFTLSIIFKLGLAGFFMGIYLRKHFTSISPLMTITFASCYALCSYSSHYYSNIMWIDGFMLFPLIILCLEMLYDKKKPFLYSIILGVTIISNFYIGFMICIFCVLYYTYLLFIDKTINLRRVINSTLRFLLYSGLAGGLSALVTIPAFYGLLSSISGNTDALSLYKEYYPFYVNFFRLMFNASPTFMNSPYLHSSVIVFLAFPLFIFNKKIDLKIRLGRTFLLIFMMLSFQIRILDYIWNGFHITKGFAGRQSFIFIFLMILMIIDELLNYSKKDVQLTISFALSAFTMVMSYIYYDLSWFLYLTIFNILLIILYYIIFRINKKIITVSCIFIVIELVLSVYCAINPGYSNEEYCNEFLHSKDTISLIKNDSFFRIKNDCKSLQNEGCVLSYNSIPIYSSFASNNTANTLMALGFYIGDNAYDDTSYEPVTMSILGIKYVISDNANLESDILKPIANYNDEYIYLNNYCLPIGFATYNKLPTADSFNTDNPFETINSIVYSLSGIENIYTPVKLENTLNNGEDIYIYGMNILSNVVFKSNIGTEEILYPNEKMLLFAKKHNYIFHITDSVHGGSFLTDNDLSEVIAYSLDHDKLAEFYQIASYSTIELNDFNSGYMYGTIKLEDNGKVFTSIPYSEGWTVTIDGKKVNTYSVNDSLLAFDIEEGEHEITFEYTTKGLLIGSLISVISVILLICVTIIPFINKKR